MWRNSRNRERRRECVRWETASTVSRSVLLSRLSGVVVMTTDSSCSSRRLRWWTSCRRRRLREAPAVASTAWHSGQDDRKSDTRRRLSDVYFHLGAAGRAPASFPTVPIETRATRQTLTDTFTAEDEYKIKSVPSYSCKYRGVSSPTLCDFSLSSLYMHRFCLLNCFNLFPLFKFGLSKRQTWK